MAAKTTLTDAQDKFIELTAKTGAQMTTRMTRSLIRLGFLDNGNELTDLGREYAIAQGWIVVEPPAPTEAPHAAPVDSADSEPVSAYVGDTIETDNGTRGVVAELYSVFDQDMVRFTRSDNGESMGLPDYHIVKVIDAEAKPFAIGDTVIFDNAGEPTIAQVMRVVGSGGYEVAYNKTPGSFLAFAEAHELAHAAQPTSAAGGDAVSDDCDDALKCEHGVCIVYCKECYSKHKQAEALELRVFTIASFIGDYLHGEADKDKALSANTALGEMVRDSEVSRDTIARLEAELATARAALASNVATIRGLRKTLSYVERLLEEAKGHTDID